MTHQERPSAPLIVAFVDDLMAASRIENVASHLGYRLQVAGKAEELAPGAESPLPSRPGEPLHGSLAALFDTLTTWQPALLIFDLTNRAIPWPEWLAIIKSSPATRRIPVVCYGPHVDKQALAAAGGLVTESDVVVPRSRFFSALPDILSNTVRVADHAAIAEACSRPLSAIALEGLLAFNQAQYFKAHEHLEDAWNEEQGTGRELYQAVLQVAVAYLQITRRNYRGAAKMFLRARQWLDPLPDTCRGIDINRLRIDAENARQSLLELGPEGLVHFDDQSLQPVHYDLDR